MSITDELREFMDGADGYELWCPRHKKELAAIADRIDAEHKKACYDAWDNGYEADYLGIESWLTEHPQVMEHHGWIRLPKDADGVPWNAGDRDEDGNEVFELVLNSDGWYLVNGTKCVDKADSIRHYHAPTVEDVLTEMVAKAIERGELTNGAAQTIAEYASKLQLREDA